MRRVLMLMSVVFLGCVLGLTPMGLAQTTGFTQIAPTGAVHGTFANGINTTGSSGSTCLAPGWVGNPGQHNGQTQGQHVGLCNNPNAVHTGGGGSQMIVGYYLDANMVPNSYTLSGTGFNTVSVPGASYTYTNGVNSSGQFAGTYVDSATGRAHGFVLSGGAVTTLDVPGAMATVANGINSAGQVVGYFSDIAGYHGFLYSGGTFATFDYTDPTGTRARATFATGINASGQVVGYYYNSHFAIKSFQRSSAGSMSALDIPGALLVSARGINTSGQVAGFYVDSSNGGHGFVFTPGTPATITNVDVPGSLYTAAFGLNDSGEVVGIYVDGTQTQFGFHMP